MIKSMTGFGRSEITEGSRKITVEMKSVNHRYLDVNIKLPKKLNYYESSIRTQLKNDIERGKVDIYITYEDFKDSDSKLVYNEELAKQYLRYIEQMSYDLKVENDVTSSVILKCPDVFTMLDKETDEEQLTQLVDKAFHESVQNLVSTRISEGENLKNDLIIKLDEMEKCVQHIEERSPIIVSEYRKKVEDKVKELLQNTQIDESRIVMEVTLFADKICVDEETVRLTSHIKSMRESLQKGGSVGRRLDFVAQEMNREANTILSKSSDIIISDVAIELKTLIEKIREQIQNIE